MSEKALQEIFADDPGYIAMYGYRTARRFTLIVWILSLLTAIVAIWQAWNDRSWGALRIAFTGAPAANAAIVIGSQITLWICRCRNRTMPLGMPMMASVFAPLISFIITEKAIFSMGLHGC
jgi:hypothetical protein